MSELFTVGREISVSGSKTADSKFLEIGPSEQAICPIRARMYLTIEHRASAAIDEAFPDRSWDEHADRESERYPRLHTYLCTHIRNLLSA